jgi:hypothetical protein
MKNGTITTQKIWLSRCEARQPKMINFWWRGLYVFACFPAINFAGAIVNLQHRFLDGYAAQRNSAI